MHDTLDELLNQIEEFSDYKIIKVENDKLLKNENSMRRDMQTLCEQYDKKIKSTEEALSIANNEANLNTEYECIVESLKETVIELEKKLMDAQEILNTEKNNINECEYEKMIVDHNNEKEELTKVIEKMEELNYENNEFKGK